jgi:hypothetical protein
MWIAAIHMWIAAIHMWIAAIPLDFFTIISFQSVLMCRSATLATSLAPARSIASLLGDLLKSPAPILCILIARESGSAPPTAIPLMMRMSGELPGMVLHHKTATARSYLLTTMWTL